jgi:hypothetical protein
VHGLPGRSSRAIRAAHFLHRATRYAVHHRTLVTRWIEGDVELLGKCGGDEADNKGGGYQQLLHNLLLGLVDALSAYGVVKPRLGKSNGSTICDYLRQKEAGRWVCDPWVRTRPGARGVNSNVKALMSASALFGHPTRTDECLLLGVKRT